MKNPTKTKPVVEKTWDEFRSTGLFLFVNQFLQIFGWSLVMVTENGSVKSVFPGRVKYRGFSSAYQSEEYIKISEYMSNNATQLKKEAK